jgi:hypothetical protein
VDEFHKRLEDSLNRVRKRPETEVVLADSPPTPSDEFQERLRRAVGTGRNGAGAGDAGPAHTASSSPVNMDGLPPDLRTVVENWPRLPGFVRAFIVNMVQANREPQAA